MKSAIEKLYLRLLNKTTGKVIYEHEIELMEFQKETLQNENVSFFYTFKDIGVEVENIIASKLQLGNNKDKICFVITYLDKTLFESILDVTGIEECNMQKNEVQLYYIFDKVSKNIISKISEEHKNIILSNAEKG